MLEVLAGEQQPLDFATAEHVRLAVLFAHPSDAQTSSQTTGVLADDLVVEWE